MSFIDSNMSNLMITLFKKNTTFVVIKNKFRVRLPYST